MGETVYVAGDSWPTDDTIYIWLEKVPSAGIITSTTVKPHEYSASKKWSWSPPVFLWTVGASGGYKIFASYLGVGGSPAKHDVFDASGACVATAPDFSICQGTTLDDPLFTGNGASCSAGCTMTLDYSGVDSSTPGTYDYTVTCVNGPCSDTATGTVTVVEFCEATAPDFSICQGTTVNDLLFTDNGASCSAGCTVSLSYSFDGTTVGAYTYTVTCLGDCGGDTDTGTVTVVEFCEATAPDFSICQGTTVNDPLFLDHGASCTAGCTVSLSYSFDGNTPGPYTYTVTCVGDCGGDTDEGTVTVVEFCVATAPDFSICQGTTVNDLLFTDNGASCTGGCTVSLTYSFDGNTPGPYTYTVTCLGDCGGDTDTGTVTVVEFCVATAPDFSICKGTTVNDLLFTDNGASCSAGCTVSLSYSFDGNTPGPYTYTVTCLGDCGGDTDEGTVTVVEFCVATAPDFSICQGTTVNDLLFTDNGASCTGGCTVSLTYSFDGSTVGAYTYTVTCLGDCGGDTDEGTVTVVEFCEATAPDFSICKGTTVNDLLFTDNGASCTGGCTVSLTYSFDGNTPGPYTYTVTCVGDCGGDTDTGTVTVVEFCVATAPDFSICQGTTVNDLLFTDNGASCSAGCTVSLSYSFDGSTVGAYTYTVTCLGDCGGDTDTGTVTVVEFCVATAPDFSICQGTTVNDLLFTDNGASCSAGCTVSLSYSFDGSTVGAYTYTVTCLGDCGGDTDTGTVTVVEFCVATAPDFSICQGTTVNDLLFTDNGASCSAGCTVSLTYSFDGSTVGAYTYTVTCLGDCGGDTDTGTVTVVEFCVATAPDFSICQGTTVNDLLFTDNGASCSAGCTVSLTYSFDGSTVGAYTYTVTCLGDCGGDTDTGTVTVVEFCVATAPDFSICKGTTVNDLLFTDNGASCSAGCTVSLSYSFDGSTVGAYTYTVTCLGDCGGDTDTGTVTVVEFCVATAPDFSICKGTTVNDLLFTDNGASCSAGCTVSLSYSFDGSTVGAYTYTVTCLGDCGGDTDTGTVKVVEFCVATAPDFSICQGTTVNDLLFTDNGASCSAGCTVSLTYSFDGNTVGAYTYTVTCVGDCGGDTDTGTVTVVEFCVATAPDFSICQGTTVNDLLFTDNGASCSAGCTVSLTYSFDGSTVGAYTYTVTCVGDCGGDTDEGTVTVRDCAPPVIVSVTQSNDEPCAGEDVTITAHVTDDVGVTTVTLTYDTTTIPMSMTSGTATDGYWQATIPGQPACTTLSIFVTARDAEGNEVSSTPHEKHWKDCAPPVIVSATQSNDKPCAGEDVVITAHVTDDAGVTAVNLTYDGTTVPMTLSSGTANDGKWTAIIPGQPAGTTLTIFVTATDGENTVSSTPHEKHWKDCAPVVELEKSGSPAIVAPGGNVTYTINYTNNGAVPLHDVVITEHYPNGVTFISASPAPDAGTNNKWTIGTLLPGESGTIVIKVKVPEPIDLSFTETGSVIGEGVVMVSKDLSTKQKPYSLRNSVTLSCAQLDPVSRYATTKVSGVPGTSLGITESGSGVYSSDENLDLETKNKTIILKKTTHAEYKPTSFNFSDSFSVNFTNKWKQDIETKNCEIGAAIHKKISDATYIDDETISRVDKDKSVMSFVSSFNGSLHIGARTKDTEISETYIGEFDVLQTIQIAKGPIPTPAPTPTPTPIWLPCPYNDSQGNTTEDAEPTP